MYRVLAVLLCCFGATTISLIAPSKADSSCYGHNYATNYDPPTAVVTPVVFQVPAFQFQYTVPQIPPVAINNEPIGNLPQNSVDIKELAKAVVSELNNQTDEPPVAIIEDKADNEFRSKRGTLSDSIDLQAQTILSQHCARCHTGAKSARGFEIFTQQNILNTQIVSNRQMRKLIWSVSDDESMPYGAKQNKQLSVPDDQMAILKQWVLKIK